LVGAEPLRVTGIDDAELLRIGPARASQKYELLPSLNQTSSAPSRLATVAITLTAVSAFLT